MNEAVAPRRGRPPAKNRVPENPYLATDTTPRDPRPAPIRERRTGRIEVEGHGGVKLSRKRSGNTDPYAIPPHVIPTGWDYQWNTYTIVGQQAVDSQILMAENGWRPVPSERHAGMFMPEGHKGHILRGGMILEERPMALTIEAREEDQAKATGQVRDQNESLFGSKNFGRGFENRAFNGRSRAQGEGVRMGVDVAADAPRPRLEIDPG